MSSTSLLVETTSYSDGDYRLAGMCSSPVIVGVGGGGGGGGLRPSSVETNESIVSRSPDADRDPIDDQDLSDRVLDQILREHGGAISFGNAVQSFESCFEQAPIPSKAKSRRNEGSLCRVCGDEATGMYFGALVCVPCKTFYLRYAGSNQSFSCKERRCCAITVASRTNCKFCRYQKCIRVGMHRKERPCQVHVTDGQQVCSVCHDVANGVHFGVITCEGCKKFFRRGLVENLSYVCKNNGNCEVNPRTRNACRFCRYQKCLQVGMSREAIQMGRPSKPRFERDPSTTHESFRLIGSLVPFNSSSAVKETNGCGGGGTLSSSSGHSSINSSSSLIIPFSSQPLFSHLITNQCSTSTNSSGHSSSKVGLLSPAAADVIQKMEEGDRRWNETIYQQPQQQLNMMRSNLWSSVEGLNGGEMVEMVSQEQQRVLPKQELESDSDGHFTEGHCFRLNSGDARRSERQVVIPTRDYSSFPDERSQAAAAAEEFHPSLWQRSQPKLSSDPSPVSAAAAGILSSSPSLDSRANSCLSLSGRIDALISCGNSHQMKQTSSSLTNNTSLETMPSAVDARDNGDVDASNVNRALEEISGRRVLTDLQFPLKSVIRIIHSSVANELPETQHCHKPLNIEGLMDTFKNYWLYDETGEDPFIVHYSNIYQEVIAAYKTFVIHSQYVNFLLRTELEKCQSDSNYNVVNVQWIQDNVVPFYVELSIRYCRQLPGFSSFDLADQQMLIRLGQSPSRILAAAVHWYRPDKRDFGDFLSWRRNDKFKCLMAEHAEKIYALDLDLVEASLLNAALIIATDYPNLVNREPIERQHQDLLAAYKTYTTGKLGTPNDRFQTVIGHMRQVRHLGFLHYEMTKTKNMMAEDVTQPR